jgi:pyruvate kinase
MSTICKAAEQDSRYLTPAQFIDEMRPFRRHTLSPFAHTVANSAVFAATDANAKVIIAFTHTANLPMIISKRRPRMPILAITSDPSAYRKLSLYYGVYPILSEALEEEHIPSTGFVPKYSTLDQVLTQAEKDIMDQWKVQESGQDMEVLTSTVGSIVEKGDIVVFCAGYHTQLTGLSHTVKVANFGELVHTEMIRSKWDLALSGIKSERSGI